MPEASVKSRQPGAKAPVRLFYCYDPADSDLREQLEKHLSALKRQGVIEGWHDRCLRAGDDLEAEEDRHLAQADIVLLLVSADFLASSRCYLGQLAAAMERQRRGEARVVSILIRPCDYSGTPIEQCEVLPTDGKPVTSWTSRDGAWLDVARGIRQLVEGAQGSAKASHPGFAWRWRISGAIAAGIALLAGLGFVAQRRRQQPPAPPPGMVLISGATFLMGSEEAEVQTAQEQCRRLHGEACDISILTREQPARKVQLSPFFLDRAEVSNADFASWLGTLANLREEKALLYQEDTLLVDLHPEYSAIRAGGGRFRVVSGAEDRPATLLTWQAAARFCATRGTKLPSEAQWELAARGSKRRMFPWGNEPPRCGEVQFGGGPEGVCPATVRPASVLNGGQDRTPEGVLNLGGNVAEWVADAFRGQYPPCAKGKCLDPLIDEPTADSHVIRGGHYKARIEELRAASRSRARSSQPLLNVGFRCALPLSERKR